MGQPRYVVSLVEVPRVHVLVEAGDVRQPNIGLVTRVENLPRRLERVLDDVEMDTTKINREAEKAHAGLVDVFPRAGELAEVRAKRAGSRPSWPPTAPRRPHARVKSAEVVYEV